MSEPGTCSYKSKDSWPIICKQGKSVLTDQPGQDKYLKQQLVSSSPPCDGTASRPGGNVSWSGLNSRRNASLLKSGASSGTTDKAKSV